MHASDTGRGLAPDEAAVEKLRGLIGRRVEYRGLSCTIHDVLADPAILVLKPADGGADIQADTFGKAARRAPGFIEIRLAGDDEAGPADPLAEVRLLPEPGSG